MKILHVLDHSIPLHSGYTFRTRAILAQQAAMGWSTVQLTSGKQGPTPESVELVGGFRFHRTPAPAGVVSMLPGVQQLRIIRDLERRLDMVVQQERPDLIHAHSPALNGVAALRVGMRRAIPVVYECRAFWEDAAADHGTSSEWGPRYRLTRALETHVFRRADAVICICEGLRRDILGRGVDPRKVAVVPNAVDLEQFRLETSRDDALAESLGLQDATVLGFVGSFYAYEGLDLAIRAVAEIAQTNQEVHLLLVGGGPEDERLRGLVVALGLSSLVHFTGRVAHSDVHHYYGLIDVLVYPRRSMRLTDLVTPLKPLEAMAQGKLVLASDVGGHQELITDGQNGRLFASGDSAALASAALAMIEDRASWRVQCAAGRRFVEEERNWPRSVARYEQVYGPLLDAHDLDMNARAASR
ncbi:MAG: TIGR04063 family PEP-CTERM/XrtA system glycosyltransferase [Thiohalocapsa sp.]